MNIKEIALNYGVDIPDEGIFQRFADYLYTENQKMDLTAIKEKADIFEKHFLDSLAPIKHGLIKENAKVIDIGCGAGFPSLPIFFARRDISLTCLDSLTKRIDFINRFANLEGLKLEALSARAEELAKKEEYRQQYDICLSRAVASLPVLCELCLPFVKVGGLFVALKGPAAYEELEKGQNAINLLGGAFKEIIPCGFEGDMSGHCLVVIEKVKNTHISYPRRYNRISKNPL